MSNENFRKFSAFVSKMMGSSKAFILAVVVVLIWAATGPIFHYSDTWQLIINTSTTVVTFWMVFVIQNTQNRQDIAIQLKLDELLKAVTGARNSLINIEELSEEELANLQEQFKKIKKGI
jgi:low affinity Fe/Cu permease